MRIRFFTAVALALASTGCSKTEENAAPPPSAQSSSAKAAVAPASAAPPTSASVAPAVFTNPNATAELKIASVGNTMAYDVATMTVAAGQQVHIVLKNNSTMDVMPHNWTLVKPGHEASVAAAGLKAGPTAGYLATGDENVLASTPLAAKGTSVEVTFTAPAAPGNYPYICTVPGHYLKMKGVLVVTP